MKLGFIYSFTMFFLLVFKKYTRGSSCEISGIYLNAQEMKEKIKP